MDLIIQFHPLLPFIVALVVGLLAENIFKTSAYGRLVDGIIGLVGGLALYFPVARVHNTYDMAWGSDVVTLLILSAVAIVGALVLLFVARRVALKRA